jgi:MFS family permease
MGAGATSEQTKRFAVLAAAAGLSTWAADTAATQVGLPSMQASLGISVTTSQWILNLTLMVLAGLVTVGGALGDRLGRLKVFRGGLLVLLGGALVTAAGGFLTSLTVVLAGRALEGVGAALALPATTALVVDLFQQQERGAAQGRMMVIAMLVTAFAPTLLGLVIQFLSWPVSYLFVALGALITLFLLRRVAYTQSLRADGPFDLVGSLLLFVAVALITFGFMQASTLGFTAPTVLLLVAGGLATATALVLISLRKAHPLVQFRILAIRNVAIALVVTLLRFLPNVLMGAFVARYVQQVLGLSPTVTGLLMILPILAQVVAAPVAGRMLDKAGPRLPVSLGVGLLALGAAGLAVGFPAQNLWLIVIASVVGGAGFAFTNPVQMAALNQTPLEQRGMLAGLFPLAGQFGTTLWVALLTAGLGALMARYLESTPGASEGAAQAAALGTLAWIAAGAMLLTLVAALLLRNVGAQQAAQAALAPPEKAPAA